MENKISLDLIGFPKGWDRSKLNMELVMKESVLGSRDFLEGFEASEPAKEIYKKASGAWSQAFCRREPEPRAGKIVPTPQLWTKYERQIKIICGNRIYIVFYAV